MDDASPARPCELRKVREASAGFGFACLGLRASRLDLFCALAIVVSKSRAEAEAPAAGWVIR
jgi:hypothetical protein